VGYLADWWKRRTCRHNWELVEKEKILDGPGPMAYNAHGAYRYVYRCRNCGATKAKMDQWGVMW
jgi:hypothetical protein